MGITDKPDLKFVYEYARKYSSDDSDRGLFLDFEMENIERKKVQDILNSTKYHGTEKNFIGRV